MLRYQSYRVTFAEIPDEITLCIEIAGCKLHCPGCHSPWLWEDKGTELTVAELQRLVNENPGITCVCLMGGDQQDVANLYWDSKLGIALAWYTGLNLDDIKVDLTTFNYLKVGPYIAERGPLNKRTTNQRLYRVDFNDVGIIRLEDITSKFWQSNVETGDELRNNGGDQSKSNS